jgi:hypothetical protein
MASKKPEIQIPPPATGVRRDVDPLVRTPEMASEGDNVVYFDGTIRPRPALQKEIDDPITGLPVVADWTRIYESAAPDDEPVNWAAVTSQNYILVALNSDEWRMSTDNGVTWFDPGIDLPFGVGPLTESPIWMQQFGDNLYAITPNGGLNVAPVSTLPTSLTWTELTSTGPSIAYGNQHLRSYWDEAHDALVILSSRSAQYYPHVWAFYNLTGATSYADFDPPYSLSPATIDPEISYSDGAGEWVQEKWHVIPVYKYVAPGTYRPVQKFHAFRFEWDDDLGEYVYGSTPEIMDLGRGTDFNPFGFPLNTTTRIGRCPLDTKTGGRVVFPATSQFAETDGTKSYIGSVRMDDNGFVEDSIEVVQEFIFNGAALVPHSTEKKLLYLFDNGDAYTTLPLLIASSDNGTSWLEFLKEIDPPQDLFYASWQLIASDVSDNHFGLVAGITGVSTRHELWALPSSGDNGQLGEVTTAFQSNMDDEDNVLFVGTTRAIARLDRSTNLWTRITATQDETVDTGTLGQWADDGDIPPLSVSEDDAAYENGVTLDGTYGENPWVFRTASAQGKTFLIGTNGQCDPVCYNEDMEGGFARRLGEVPPGDPNDLPLFDPLSFPAGYLRIGNLAPKARCLAVAANRVLLGNLVNGSPYGIDVSGFNDQDRGWGLEQYTLLGDTPGGIVSMNEISALQVAVYKTDAIYHAVAQTEFLGVAAPFRFELSKAGISGPCSPASVLRNHDGRQIYLARDGGVYLYDGVAPLDGGRNIRRMVQRDIALNDLGKSWGMIDTQRKLAWFFYPTASGLVNRGIVVSTDQGYPWQVWPVQLPDGWNFVAGLDAILERDITMEQLGPFGSYTEETLSSFGSADREMIMAMKQNVWFSQKWDDDGSFTDSGIPIKVLLETGWTTPGGVSITTADEMYHIFSSPDPEQELEVRLKAQQVGQNIRYSNASPLYSGKLRRRTRHRVSGVQFAVELSGTIHRMFNWGGAVIKAVKGGER